MIERVRVSGTSGSAGARPTADSSDDEPITILEPYGFASAIAGTGIALAFAPGTDSEDRVALGVSSTAGRPATDAGDVVMYSAAGHSVALDDDGGIVLTSKDGSVIDMPNTGAITITAGAGASITINVDALQSVNIGGTPAFALVKDAENSSAINASLAAGAAFVGTPGDPLGTNASGAFAAAVAGYAGAPSAATTRAKGI